MVRFYFCLSSNGRLIIRRVDLYGDSSGPSGPTTGGTVNGKSGPAKKTRSVIHLSVCDSLPAYGPIADMTFSLAKNGVRSPPPNQL